LTPFSFPSFNKFCKISGVFAGICGGALSFNLVTQQLSSATIYADDGASKHKVSKRIIRENDHSGLKLTLYQYVSCPFCCKVRAFLDCYGFSYDIVEVDSVRKKQLKDLDTAYKKVPILVVKPPGSKNELQLVDSCVIVSVLTSFIEDQSMSLSQLNTFYPALESKEKKGTDYPNKYFIMFGEKHVPKEMHKVLKEERRWRRWCDDVFIHTIAPNVYRTPSESLQTFGVYSKMGEWEKNFSNSERNMCIYFGSAVMYILGKVIKRRHNLKKDVRESMYDACNEWVKGIGKKQPFMGGQTPNLADMAVYGAMSSFEGCQAFNDAHENTKIGVWYQRMKTVAETNALITRLPIQ